MSRPQVGWCATIRRGALACVARLGRQQRAAEDQLLHVAAGQRARRRLQARRRARRSARSTRRACACAARAPHDARASARTPRCAAARTPRSPTPAGRRPRRRACRSSGMRATPRCDQRARATAAAARPSACTVPPIARARAAQQLGQRDLAVARDAGDRDDLAGAQRERHAVEAIAPAARACARAPARRPASPTCVAGRRCTLLDRMPDHPQRQLRLRRFGGRAPRPPACRRAAPRCDATRAAPRRACG